MVFLKDENEKTTTKNKQKKKKTQSTNAKITQHAHILRDAFSAETAPLSLYNFNEHVFNTTPVLYLLCLSVCSQLVRAMCIHRQKILLRDINRKRNFCSNKIFIKLNIS